MTRASALTSPEPLPEDLEALKDEFYTEPAEGKDTLAETPAQELVETGPPRTPLHIDVKNLMTREEAREREVRLLHEEVARLKDEAKEQKTATASALEERDRAYSALLARVQELGDWVDAPDWKPSKGEGS